MTGPRRARHFAGILRVALIATAVVLGGYAVLRDLDGFLAASVEIGVPRAVAAFALVAVGLGASAETWRGAVAAVASRLPRSVAWQVFFVTQLGKYLPGSVWTVLGQIEAARRHGLSRSRMAVGALLFLAIHLLTGLVVAAVLLPWGADELLARYWLALLVAPAAAIALLPPVLTRLINVGLGVTGRERLPSPLRTRELLGPAGWMLVTWIAFGLAVVVVAAPLTDMAIFPLGLIATGAFALAWSVGLLIVPAPAGLGAREAVMVLALAPAMGVTSATSVAIVLRVAHTAADLLHGFVGLRGARRDGTS